MSITASFGSFKCSGVLEGHFIDFLKNVLFIPSTHHVVIDFMLLVQKRSKNYPEMSSIDRDVNATHQGVLKEEICSNRRTWTLPLQ